MFERRMITDDAMGRSDSQRVNKIPCFTVDQHCLILQTEQEPNVKSIALLSKVLVDVFCLFIS